MGGTGHPMGDAAKQHTGLIRGALGANDD